MVQNYHSFDDAARNDSNSLDNSILRERSVPSNQNQNERTDLIPGGGSKYFKVCGFRQSSVFLILYAFGYLGYIIFGAYIMFLMETDSEVQFKESIRTTKNNFLKKHGSVTKSELEEFLNAILGNKGISPLEEDRFQRNWSVGQSVLYTSTVITTIGYGHVSPLTPEGKLFTMVYACIGIPLTLLLLSVVAKRVTEPISAALQGLVACIFSKTRDFRVKSLEVTIILFVVLSLCHLLPAVIFAILEPRWNYLDALYYTFISLTTIGLGDYIPGDEAKGTYRAVYKCLIVVYLILGLMLMTIVAELYYGIPELSLVKYFQKSNDSSISSREASVEDWREEQPTFRTRSRSLPR